MTLNFIIKMQRIYGVFLQHKYITIIRNTSTNKQHCYTHILPFQMLHELPYSIHVHVYTAHIHVQYVNIKIYIFKGFGFQCCYGVHRHLCTCTMGMCVCGHSTRAGVTGQGLWPVVSTMLFLSWDNGSNKR